MARYMSAFQTYVSPRDTYNFIYSFLQSEGYELTVYEGEQVFKKGKGLATGPTFVKVTFFDQVVQLEAWCKFAILPGVYAGEMDLDGAVGIAIKKPLRQRIQYIEQMLVGAGAVQIPVQMPVPQHIPQQAQMMPQQAPQIPQQAQTMQQQAQMMQQTQTMQQQVPQQTQTMHQQAQMMQQTQTMQQQAQTMQDLPPQSFPFQQEQISQEQMSRDQTSQAQASPAQQAPAVQNVPCPEGTSAQDTSEAASPSVCSQCGAVLNPGIRFCPMCGKPLDR